jgi:hypothetical protein
MPQESEGIHNSRCLTQITVTVSASVFSDNQHKFSEVDKKERNYEEAVKTFLRQMFQLKQMSQAVCSIIW